MSQPTRDIIDLTEGSNSPPGTRTLPNPDTDPTFTSQRANRPPRFPRDIIDVDDPESLSTLPTNTARDASPDIELLYSRTIPQGTRPQTRPQGIFGYVPTATRVDGSSADAIQNRRPSASNHSQSVRDAWTEARNQMRRDHSMNMMVGQQQPRITHQGRHLSLSQGFQDRQEGVLFMGVQPNLTLPGNLDFIAQGFPMGDIGRVHPAPPTYDAPPSPRTGFTRSPKEDNVLVCPNCDEELGMGSDDTKRQVWVVKQCGHV
ncbi:hypothetical protein MMC12_006778 [Toensbergia leucococca]|nr:hypothetical protein [Toensbergia leucococca]